MKSVYNERLEMTKNELEIIKQMDEEIKNFQACYEGNELWGDRDSYVSVEALIGFLSDHPEMQQIADRIEELNRKRFH